MWKLLLKNSFKTLVKFLTVFLVISSLLSCNHNNNKNTSAKAAITSYSINGIAGVINGQEITVTMPSGTDVTELVATFSIVGVNVYISVIDNTQVSGVSVNDFTTPVIYTVTAEDGSTIDYTVIVKVTNEFGAIYDYSINGIVGVITGNTIIVTLPLGTDVTNLIASFNTSGSTTNVSINGVTQVSDVTANNFTSPVIYAVTGTNGQTINYTVTVNLSSLPGTITSYSLNGVAGVIINHEITVTMPFGTNVTALVANFTTDANTTNVSINGVTQVNNVTANNFTSPVVYTVTATDSSTINYTVTVTVASASSKTITAFSLNGTVGVITGNAISVTMPFGTNVTGLIASFTTTGASVLVGGVTQISGVTTNNFTSPVVYTVRAADSSTATYTVTVTVAPSSAKAITAYSINGITGVITGNAVSVTMPFGTNVTGLIASFTTTGASVLVGGVTQISGVTTNNFTSPVVYTVRAADSSTATYTVTVTMSPPTNFAYVTNFATNNISMFGILSSGTLSPLATSTIAAESNPRSIIIDPTKKFLYVTNYGSNTVSMYSIPVSGILTPLSTPTVATQTQPRGIAINSAGTFVYVCNSISNTVSMYSVQASGILTPLSTPTVATGTNPNDISIIGNFAYVVNFNSKTISMYSIPASGILTPLSTPTVATQGKPWDIVINPAGTFAYVSNGDTNTISMYSRSVATGILTPLSTPTIATQNTPRELAINPAGTFLYVSNFDSNTVSMYSIPGSGILTPISQPTAVTESGPRGISINSTGNFAYVTNGYSDSVITYSILASGILTQIGLVAAGEEPLRIAIK